MTKFSPLTLAFLEQKPVPAARELAALPVPEAAQFLDDIPARFAAPVLAAMAPWSASVILCSMSTTSAAASLAVIDYRDAAAILRYVNAKDRPPILKELPKKLRRDFETSLKFPETTVGAHMTVAILTLSQDHTIADAIELFRHSEKTKSNIVQIIGKDYKLVGAIAVQDLLRHPKTTELGAVMDPEITCISARATLQSLHDLSVWDNHSELPVINRQGQTIGALLRKTVAAKTQARTPEIQSSDPSIAASILDVFYISMQGLAALVVGVQKSSPAAEEKRP